MKKIWLNFIMKDEEKVLLRMLSSVNHIIDGCVCIDTGSSDNSKKIVKDFFESVGKPCEIYDHPFVNFSDARNFALQKLKGKEGYGFWMDCDEQVIINSDVIRDVNVLKNNLIFEVHNIMAVMGETNFARRNFIDLSKEFKWTGAVHETLEFDKSYRVVNISDIKVHVNTDGNSWSEGVEKKYLRHAEILLSEVEKTNNTRDIFYLAQSYKDGGNFEKAIEWYKKRVELRDGFYEERYYAQFMIGVVSSLMNKPNSEIIFEYLKCSDIDTLRAEHILNAIIHLQREGLWQTAYLLSKMAVETYHDKNPYPQRLLFIDEGTYNGQLIRAHEVNKKVLNKND